MRPRPLPPALLWLARLVIPARQAPQVIADLEEDYDAMRGRRSAFAARWWLARECASLVLTYARETAIRPLPSATMWGRDVRLVARTLRRAPLATAGAMVLLSAGLVAVMVTAGLSDALLFRKVSASHGDALKRIAALDRQGRSVLRLSFLELAVIRQHLAAAGTVTAVNMQPAVLRTGGTDTQTMAEAVDGDYFALVGTPMALGRPLLTTDDRSDAPPAVVIAEPFWRARFGASPGVLGTIVELNGAAYAIVGVAATLGSSSYLGASVDAWVPFAHADPILNRGWRTDVTSRWFTSYVLPTSTILEVDSRLGAAAADLARQHPEPWRERRLVTVPSTVLTGGQRGSVMLLSSVLAGLGVLILATAAANLGGVFLARAAATRRQIAIHLSMGAGRAAIVRRHLIEGALVGIGGAAVALGLYAWVRTALAEIALLPTLALRIDLRLDTTVIALVGGAGVVAGMALATGPALWAARVELAGAIRDGDVRTSAGAGLTRMRRMLVATQVALSLTLMVGAALFGRSLDSLLRADLGFARERLVAMDFDLEPASAPPSARPALAREALDRVARTPGVLAAAMSNRAPVDQSTPSVEVAAASTAAVIGDVTFNLATAAYFETVGIPLVAGRAFTAAEGDSTANVAIVNETLARRLWPDGDALDRALLLPRDGTTLRIVGVARDARYRSISDEGRPHFYRPTPPTLGLTLLARTAGDQRRALADLQTALNEVGPGLIGFVPRTLDDHLAIELLPTRAAAAAASVLGTLALVLSGVGLYALVAWFVALRRREIGIRLALGATRRDVRRLVVGEALGTAIPGAAMGIALAATCAMLARAALFGVGPLDPAAFGAGVLALLPVVALAAYLPTRRASAVDPVDVLREN